MKTYNLSNVVIILLDIETVNGTNRHGFNAIVSDQDLVEVGGIIVDTCFYPFTNPYIYSIYLSIHLSNS